MSIRTSNFDKRKHADALLQASSLICKALMLCEGMEYANTQMDDRQYINAAAGAFGLMAFALDQATDLMYEAETDFRLSNELYYPAHSEGGVSA